MSKFSKICIVLLTVCVALGLVLGVTYSVKTTEDLSQKNTTYAVLLDDLEKELNVNVENVQRLEYQIELKGLTIDDLTRTIVVKEQEIVTLNNEVQEKEIQIVEKNNTIVEKQQEVQTLTQTVASKDAQIQQINNTIVEYRDRIVYLEQQGEDNSAEIASLEAEIASLENALSQANQEKANLQSELASKNETIADLQDQLAALEAEKTSAQEEVAAKEEELEETQTELAEKEEEVAMLQVNVNILNETIIELNIRIELLQNEIEEPGDRSLYEELFQSSDLRIQNMGNGYYLASTGDGATMGIYLVDGFTFNVTKIHNESWDWHFGARIDEHRVLLFSGTDNNSGLIVYNDLDNTITKVVDNGGCFFNCHYFKNGNLFITSTQYSMPFILYDRENDTFEVVYNSYRNNYCHFIETVNGDLIMGTDGLTDPTLLFNAETKEVSMILNTGSNGFMYHEFENGDILAKTNYSGKLFFYDAETRTAAATSMNGTEWQIISASSEDVFITDYNGYQNQGLYYFNHETREFIQAYDEGYNWTNIIGVDPQKALITSPSCPGILLLEKGEEGLNCSMIYDECYWSTCVKLYDERILLYSSTMNPNDWNETGSHFAIYNPENNEITVIASELRFNNMMLMPDGYVILYNNMGNSVYVFDPTDDTIKNIYTVQTGVLIINDYRYLKNGKVLFLDMVSYYDPETHTFVNFSQASGYNIVYECMNGDILISTNEYSGNDYIYILNGETMEFIVDNNNRKLSSERLDIYNEVEGGVQILSSIDITTEFFYDYDTKALTRIEFDNTVGTGGSMIDEGDID